MAEVPNPWFSFTVASSTARVGGVYANPEEKRYAVSIVQNPTISLADESP